MDNIFIGIASAVWLGILTSISPCPLATNIAAISFISRQFNDRGRVLLAGLLYMLGRVVAYTAIGILLVESLLTVSKTAFVLQKYINSFLGPILILAGLFLLEIIRPVLRGSGIAASVQKRVESYGVWGAGLLGILFALSFCPISAALFFGSLIPLAIKYNSGLLLPSLYGVGTGLPVILFAFLLALGTKYVAQAFSKLAAFEKWARRITGLIFILVGLYYTLIYIFRVPL
jgi:cytochrome c-type biogenesis protein